MPVPHEVHQLFAALVELLVGLPRVPHVLLAHLAQVLVLEVESVHLSLLDLDLLLVVPVHLHGQVARTVYRVCALLHEDYLLLQPLHLPPVLLQLLDGQLVAALGVAPLLDVDVGAGRRGGLPQCWRMRGLAVLEHQLLYSQRLALQLCGFVFALLPQPRVLLRQLVHLPEQAGRVAALRTPARLHKVQLVLELNDSAIVNVVVPALLQLELEALDFLQELCVHLLQLAILPCQQLESFASMRRLRLRESLVLLC